MEQITQFCSSFSENIGKGELLLEYNGENIRRPIADLREKQRCGSIYFFTSDEDFVVDGTYAGSIARFINHSCRSLNHHLVLLLQQTDCTALSISNFELQNGSINSFINLFQTKDYA